MLLDLEISHKLEEESERLRASHKAITWWRWRFLFSAKTIPLTMPIKLWDTSNFTSNSPATTKLSTFHELYTTEYCVCIWWTCPWLLFCFVPLKMYPNISRLNDKKFSFVNVACRAIHFCQKERSQDYRGHVKTLCRNELACRQFNKHKLNFNLMLRAYPQCIDWMENHMKEYKIKGPIETRVLL